MVEAQLVQHRGMPIGDADAILDRLVADVVRGSIRSPSLDTSSGHPGAKGVRVVVPPWFTLSGLKLRNGQPAEFARP